MKKQTKPLSLSKKTISNLNAVTMNRMVGASGVHCQTGNTVCTAGCTYLNTCKGHTCHKNCGY